MCAMQMKNAQPEMKEKANLVWWVAKLVVKNTGEEEK